MVVVGMVVVVAVMEAEAHRQSWFSRQQSVVVVVGMWMQRARVMRATRRLRLDWGPGQAVGLAEGLVAARGVAIAAAGAVLEAAADALDMMMVALLREARARHAQARGSVLQSTLTGASDEPAGCRASMR